MDNIWTVLHKLRKRFPIGSKARVVTDTRIADFADFGNGNRIGEITRLQLMWGEGEVMIEGEEFPYYQDEIEPAQDYASK